MPLPNRYDNVTLEDMSFMAAVANRSRKPAVVGDALQMDALPGQPLPDALQMDALPGQPLPDTKPLNALPGRSTPL